MPGNKDTIPGGLDLGKELRKSVGLGVGMTLSTIFAVILWQQLWPALRGIKTKKSELRKREERLLEREGSFPLKAIAELWQETPASDRL